MGLLGGKKIYVSSVLYNLAGDENERPDFLSSLIIGNIITNPKTDISDTINSGYINGPGVKLRNFYRWADRDDNYDTIGIPRGTLTASTEASTSLVENEIPHDVDETVHVLDIETNLADASRWALQWMYRNHPDDLDTDWTSDYDDETLEVVVILEDTSEHRFTPTDFDPTSDYLYASYIITRDGDLLEDPTVAEPTDLFIYRFGSGNAVLDSLLDTIGDNGGYYPFIPVRINNEFLSDSYHPDVYEQAKKAYKKSVQGKLDELIDLIEDNESLDDIDHAYVVFGVSLNVLENSSRRYLYEFFQKLKSEQASDEADYEYWKTQYEDGNEANDTWKEWLDAQSDPLDPLYGTPSPYVPSFNAIPINEVRVKGDGTFDTNLDMRITWQAITESTGTGLKKPDAKVGELWFENSTSETFRNITVDVCYLHFQVDSNNWKSLKIIGMVHRNYIYKGKYVEIGTKEALEDTDESGFLVPMHFETVRELSLVHSTQMVTACAFVVFNCYKVVKQKWYQTGLFKIVVFVAIIAVSVLTMNPAAASSAGGILGANAAVGAALGLSGTAALIAGAVANAIVAMIIIKAVSEFSTLVFGKKFGAIIGAIAAVAAIAVGGSLFQGGTFSSSIGQLSRIDNVMRLASAVGGGVQAYINASIGDIQQKMLNVQAEYEQDQKELKALYAENFGYGNAMLNPMGLTDYGSYTPESLEVFLNRTLMVGSDNAAITLSFVNDFVDMTISTDLPL